MRPNFVFELTYSQAADAKFQDVRNGRDLFYAYHGSRLENFHSILHHGLASHLNKVKRKSCSLRLQLVIYKSNQNNFVNLHSEFLSMMLDQHSFINTNYTDNKQFKIITFKTF